MTLTDTILAAAGRMADVTVNIDNHLGTVCISTPGQEDIFMQGDDAEQFIAAVDEMYDEAGDVTEDQCALCLAEPYTDLWS